MKRLFITAIVALVPTLTCAQVQQALDVGKLTIKIEPIKRLVEVDRTDKYMRLALTVPNLSNELSAGDKKKFFNQFGNWLIDSFLLSESKSLLVTAKPSIGDFALPAQTVFHQLQTSTTHDVQYGNRFITPYFMADKGDLVLDISTAFKNEADSSMANNLASALALAANLVSQPSKILTSFTEEPLKSASIDLDKKINSFFGYDVKPTNRHKFDLRTEEGLNLYAVNDNGVSKLLVTIRVEEKDTLLGNYGTLNNYPQQSEDITKFNVGEKVDTPVFSYVRTIPDLLTLYKNNISQDYHDFCTLMAQNLASAGLNKYDRAAILYAYLSNSSWNDNLTARSLINDPDSCEVITSSLDATNLKGKLKARKDLSVEDVEDSPSFKQLMKNKIYYPLLNAMKSTGNVSKGYWNKVVADKVSITTEGASLALNNDTTIELGVGISKEAFDVSSILSSSSIVWSGNDENCFTDYRNSKTFSRFRSDPTCSGIKKADGSTMPIQIEFIYDNTMTASSLSDKYSAPRLNQIRYILPADVPVVTVAQQ